MWIECSPTAPLILVLPFNGGNVIKLIGFITKNKHLLVTLNPIFKNLGFDAEMPLSSFQNISFIVSPGEVVALVGPSGGGKTSCINLLEHFYNPDLGQVLLDSRPVQEYEHHYLHRKVN